MSVGREFGKEVEVYINDDPSKIVNRVTGVLPRMLTLHENCTKKL